MQPQKLRSRAEGAHRRAHDSPGRLGLWSAVNLLFLGVQFQRWLKFRLRVVDRPRESQPESGQLASVRDGKEPPHKLDEVLDESSALSNESLVIFLCLFGPARPDTSCNVSLPSAAQ